ncbi:glutathione S-transferase family protein [Pseudomonas sp. 5P_3.1_Bac2]|uniref:glutathione S-transferase family protein n=1 Tax=Pseudomonas sp. 5P_3.1_Bac2 TaxID=2971617 RepID=UPI0021C9C354|nr:glutathione S-transferase family protein [Pseudomonas sp. 5P_3.1_Bac2]MCU1719484.1 glutathione S-transferase family protein [Pseudomonas sp. 5P_3.1_Bac2]
MDDLILHHYPTSPFAEKARLMFGFKQLAWRSVVIPAVMPKPDLLALTGGYRKTPVLQIGADIYCDTSLIARRLDQQKCTPALIPEGQSLNVLSFAQWADSQVFLTAVSLAFAPDAVEARFGQLPADFVQGFIRDRAALFSGGTASRVPLNVAQQQWPTLMTRLEQQLQQRPGEFLFGSVSLADLALAHPLWFLRATPVTAPWVDIYPTVAQWLDRVLALGYGQPSVYSAEQALAVAKAATPAPLPTAAQLVFNGLAVGRQVSVAALDYGVDPVVGELLYSSAEELIVRREDPRAGVLHVHFPRLGFALTAV